MTTVTIVLTDTPDGMVSSETTVHGYDPKSNAQALASKLNETMAELCAKQAAEVLVIEG